MSQSESNLLPRISRLIARRSNCKFGILLANRISDQSQDHTIVVQLELCLSMTSQENKHSSICNNGWRKLRRMAMKLCKCCWLETNPISNLRGKSPMKKGRHLLIRKNWSFYRLLPPNTKKYKLRSIHWRKVFLTKFKKARYLSFQLA